MSDDARSCVVIVTAVSCGNPSIGGLADNQYNRIGRSDFGGNRIYSNRESECSTQQQAVMWPPAQSVFD